MVATEKFIKVFCYNNFIKIATDILSGNKFAIKFVLFKKLILKGTIKSKKAIFSTGSKNI